MIFFGIDLIFYLNSISILKLLFMKNIFILFVSFLFISLNAFSQENKIFLKVNFYENFKIRNNNHLLFVKINDTLINIATYYEIKLPIEKCELNFFCSNIKYNYDIYKFINEAKDNDTLIVEINLSTILNDNNLMFYYDIDYNIYSIEINKIKKKWKYNFLKKMGFCVDNFIWLHPLYHDINAKENLKSIIKDRNK